MRVALIYPPVEQIDDNSSLKAQEKNLGIFPPLTLCYVASIIEEAGHEVDLIDVNALRLSVEEVAERIRRFHADLLGFTVTTYMFHNALRWIRVYKNILQKPVLVGGAQLGLYPKEILTHPEIDYALIGEAETNLPAFLSAWDRKKDLEQVPGICFRRNGSVIVRDPSTVPREIDTIPFPARHHLPNERYYSFISRRSNFTTMITTRGCPFHCIFCAQQAKLRVRSAGNVLDEMTEIYERCAIREIDIFDTNFTMNKKRAVEISHGMNDREFHMEWTARTRCDLVDRPLLQAMARAGCRLIMYGIESGDENILRNLKKEIALEQIREVIRWTHEAKIRSLGFFMIGSPGETRETVMRTLQLAKELDLDHIQVTKTTPFSGTELYKRYVEETGDDNWRRYILDPSEKGVFKLIGTHLTSQEVQSLIRHMYIAFYFRPLHILRLLFRSGSIRIAKRYAVAAIDMLRSRYETESVS